MDNEAPAGPSTSTIIMMTQIEVPILKAYEEEIDKDPAPEPQPIDPGTIKYPYSVVIEVDISEVTACSGGLHEERDDLEVHALPSL
jgi:hypothetical protein